MILHGGNNRKGRKKKANMEKESIVSSYGAVTNTSIGPAEFGL